MAPLAKEQIEDLRLLRNRPENRVWFFDSAEISRKQQEAWFSSQQAAKRDYLFAVAPRQDPNVFFGIVSLYHYDEKDESFEVGRLLLDAKKVPLKGLGKEVVFAACKIGFEKLFAKRLYAELFVENERSHACFTANGFTVTGTKELQKRTILILEKTCPPI